MNSTAELAHQTPDPALPDWVKAQVAALQFQLTERDAELKRRELKIQQLTLELAHHKRIRFGCKSEVLTSEQRDLFADACDEDGAAIVAELEQQKPATTPRQYKRAGRNPLPSELPRIEHRHEPESCTCGECGRDLVKIGERRQVDRGPDRVFQRIEHPFRARFRDQHLRGSQFGVAFFGGEQDMALEQHVRMRVFMNFPDDERIFRNDNRAHIHAGGKLMCQWAVRTRQTMLG